MPNSQALRASSGRELAVLGKTCYGHPTMSEQLSNAFARLQILILVQLVSLSAVLIVINLELINWLASGTVIATVPGLGGLTSFAFPLLMAHWLIAYRRAVNEDVLRKQLLAPVNTEEIQVLRDTLFAIHGRLVTLRNATLGGLLLLPLTEFVLLKTIHLPLSIVSHLPTSMIWTFVASNALKYDKLPEATSLLTK